MKFYRLGVDRVLQPLELQTQGADPREVTLEETGLQPSVEVFDAALAPGFGGWDEHRLDPEAQTQPQHPRQVAGRRTPAHELAGIVELDHAGSAEGLPAVAEKGQDRLLLAGTAQFPAHGAVEDVLARPQVVPLALPQEVDQADAIDLMDVVGIEGLRRGIGVARDQGRKPDPRHAHAVALKHSFDRPRAGEGLEVQSFEFGDDRLGANETVARARMRLRFDPFADRQDGLLQVGREPARMVIDARQFEEPLGALGPIPLPPAMEPIARTPQDTTNRVDRFACQAKLDRPLAILEFVFHCCLRDTNLGRLSHRATVNEEQA